MNHSKYNTGRIVLLILGLALIVSSNALARIFFITDTRDSTRYTSLRGAIIAANSARGDNFIVLGNAFAGMAGARQPWIYHLTLSGANDDAGRSGDLDVTGGNLTIVGVSPGVTIDATGLGDRVFQVFKGANLKLLNLTITGGRAPQADIGNFYAPTHAAQTGGGIYNAGTLVMTNCIITNNASGDGNSNPGNAGGSPGADGGGIYNSGTLQAAYCVIDGNRCGQGYDGADGGNGGGLKNDGTCSLYRCTIAGNLAGAGGTPAGNAAALGGSGGTGGGICNAGGMTVDSCVIQLNGAGTGAGGIGLIYLTNNPFTIGPIIVGLGFGSGGDGGTGGGIYNSSQLHLANCVVGSNVSGFGGPSGGGRAGNGGDGAGIFNAGNLTAYGLEIGFNWSGYGAPGALGFGPNVPAGGRGGNGAGIYNTGTAHLFVSTICQNLCGAGGAGGSRGLFFVSVDGAGGNGGDGGNGGGIFNQGLLNICSCTIVYNQTGLGGNGGAGLKDPSESPASSGGMGGDGGGIANDSANTNGVIQDTLVALNKVNSGGQGGTNYDAFLVSYGSPQPVPGIPGAEGLGADLAGPFLSQGFNLIGTADGSIGFVNGVHADQAGTDANPIDPLLAQININGGMTPTYALLPGSPAIDQGNCFGIHTDQRGHARPHDYSSIPNAPGGDGSDIGAFELDTSQISTPK